MLSSMLKLNLDKTEFIIFGLLVRIFGNFMHPTIEKNLGVSLDANFCFADHAHNPCITCFIQMYDLRKVIQCPKDEAAILAANDLLS